MAEWTSVPVESSYKGKFLNSSCKGKFTRRKRETLTPVQKSQVTERFEKGALQWKNFRRLKKK